MIRMHINMISRESVLKRFSLLFFLFLLLSCTNKDVEKDNENQETEQVPEEPASPINIEASDWDLFFGRLANQNLKKNDSPFFFDNYFLPKPFYDSAKKLGYRQRSVSSIYKEIEERNFRPIGGIYIFQKDDKYFVLSDLTIDKIDGLPLSQLQNISFFTSSIENTGFFEATDTPRSYPTFNKEHNIIGVFDWDSPLIAPDTFIPADKVIIIDSATLEISVQNNEDKSYVVFIDSAFLE